MSETGKKIAMGISMYLILKQLLNVILGAGVLSMILPVFISVFLYLNVWEYTNYAAAALITLVALRYLPDNLRNLPSSWLYLTEGILDIGVSAVLILSQDVKAYFNKSE
ncbi:MAG: hypothetical protein IJ642_09335 [Oscillospiraceae bacterium]|nr:hypothetical protein [Oscillospiraceae bacterium]